MKIFLIALFAIVALTLSSCEKENSTTFTVDATAFPTASEVVIDLVPSENTDVAIPVVDARLGVNEFSLTYEQTALIKDDAYYSVILFDKYGEYLTQNFFPIKSQLLKLKAE